MLYSGCINIPQRVDQRWVAPWRRSLVVGQLCGQTSMNRAHNPNPKNQLGLWICGPVQDVSACRRRRRSRNVSTKWWGDVDLGCGVVATGALFPSFSKLDPTFLAINVIHQLNQWIVTRSDTIMSPVGLLPTWYTHSRERWPQHGATEVLCSFAICTTNL
jgi:hypothetical protein